VSAVNDGRSDRDVDCLQVNKEVRVQTHVGSFSYRLPLVACGVAVALVAFVAGHASGHPSTSYVTFSGTVALPGVVMPAGTYTFEVANPETGGDVVRVASSDRRLQFLGYTRHVQRPRSLDPNKLVVFGETAPGSPTPIRVWYPIGASTGHEFIYR
jgi:hypothetical protein